MRNTVLFLAMALMYALTSHLDYQDEKMLEAHASEIRADMDCRAMGTACAVPEADRLLLSSRSLF